MLLKKITFLFFLALFIPHVLVASDAIVKSHLKQAQIGDWIVLRHDHMLTLLIVRETANDALTLEEISLPETEMKKRPSSWSEWIANGAEGQVAWLIYKIDYEAGTISNVYSKTRACWVENPEGNGFLSTLARLAFTPIPESDRKRTGRSKSGNEETRPLWQPPLYINGKRIRNATFEAWKTIWPKDGSELSDKKIELYFPTNRASPTCFPHWIQVAGAVGAASLQVVDSGKNLIQTPFSYPTVQSKKSNALRD